MKDQLEQIRRLGRVRLASILERIAPMPLRQYSASVWEHDPCVDMEDELNEAFGEEFEANQWPEQMRYSALEHLNKYRVLQTATHLTVTEGPTFLAVHHMATAGLDADEPYLVGAFSGVPFSNPAWSGCLNFSSRFKVGDVLADGARDLRKLRKDDANRRRDGVTDSRRISMVPSRMRDTLVYRAPAPRRMFDIIEQLRPSLSCLVPERNDIFCKFALSFSQTVTRKALRRKQMWYFDLNEVISSYLMKVLSRHDHPMHKLLFDEKIRKGLEIATGKPVTWFYTPNADGSRRGFSKVLVDGDRLVSRDTVMSMDPQEVCLMLEMGFLCPGVLLTFAALAFVNRFRCLGSFEQVEYLEKFRSVLSELQWPHAGALDSVDTSALTTGRCIDDAGVPVYPLDIVLGLKWKPSGVNKVWDLINPLLPRLLGKVRG